MSDDIEAGFGGFWVAALEVVEFVFSGTALNTSARVLPVFGQLDFARENLLYDWTNLDKI